MYEKHREVLQKSGWVMFGNLFGRNQKTISTILRVFSILDKTTKYKIAVVSVIQILLSILDLISVALVGVIASLTIRGVQSIEPGARTEKVLQFFRLDGLDLQIQVLFLAGFSVTLLVGKTVCSILVTKRTLKFLSRRSEIISRALIHKVLDLPLNKLMRIGIQKFQYDFGAGITSISIGIIGVGTTVVADFSLLLILGIGLLYLSPSVAFISFVFFGTVAFVLHLVLRTHAQRLGSRIRESEIKTNTKIRESFLLYRELYVRSSRAKYADEISDCRGETARAQADQTLLPNLSKYVIEVAIVFGATLIAGIQFLTQTATVALASLGLFLMAGSRIAPALLRLQQSFMVIESNIASAQSTLEVLEEYSQESPSHVSLDLESIETGAFEPKIKLENVSLKFEGSTALLDKVNLEILPGEFVAFVGPSGSGKTSLVNLILGLINPSSGSVFISGVDPKYAVNNWPGAISYVPQEVHLIDGSIKENIELGIESKILPPNALVNALSFSQLLDFTSSLTEGMDSQIGENGRVLSGGQRQRLGLARALLTSPRILVLDEATSALDGGTERAISDLLSELRGSVTVVVVAHRLSTVQSADRVIYLDQGNVLADGSFDSVRDKLPDFDLQARLMGL